MPRNLNTETNSSKKQRNKSRMIFNQGKLMYIFALCAMVKCFLFKVNEEEMCKPGKTKFRTVEIQKIIMDQQVFEVAIIILLHHCNMLL